MDTTIESQKAMDNSGEDIDSGPLANALLLHIKEYYGKTQQQTASKDDRQDQSVG
jgi:hypothetical protein